jgi:hypothetical protein
MLETRFNKKGSLESLEHCAESQTVQTSQQNVALIVVLLETLSKAQTPRIIAQELREHFEISL